MKRRVIIYFMIIILTTLSLVMIGFGIAIRQYYYQGIVNTFKNKAEITIPSWSRDIDFNNAMLQDYSNQIIDDYKFSGTELQLLDRRGSLIQSSTGFYEDKAYSIDSSVLACKTVYDTQKEKYTGEKIIVVYCPLTLNGQVVGILRYAASLGKVDALIMDFLKGGAVICVIVAAIVLFVSLRLGNSIVKPVEDVTYFAHEMANGDYRKRIHNHYPHEMGEMAKMLNYMADEILKTDRLKNDFISSISHELRTPLTGIKGWVETMRDPEGLSRDEFQFGLKMINDESERLIGLVENLLDFSRYQSDRMELSMGYLQVDKLVLDAVFQLQKQAEAKGIKLVVETSPAAIMGDRDKLKQVVLNVLHNAIKFSYNNSVVKVTQSMSEDGVVIEIKDSGIGIEENNLKHIGESFYKIEQKSIGAGLGLAISKSIIEMHGGKFELYSEYGKGTTVRIILGKEGELGGQ